MSDRQYTPRHWDAGYLVDEESERAEVRADEAESWDLVLDALDPENRQSVNVGVRFSSEAFAQLYVDVTREFEAENGLPVIRLFKNGTRRELLRFALEKMSSDSYDTAPRHMHEAVDRSSSAVDMNRGILEQFGIIEVNNPDAPTPHYRLANTRVVKLLQAWEGVSLAEFFDTTRHGVHKLVQFFLTQATPGEWYSQQQIIEQSAAGYDAVKDNLGKLVDTGFVTDRQGDGRAETEYKANLHSPLHSFLLELNEAARREFSP